jgi:two-component system, NarL family, sensor histidine kinase UhpB
MQQTLERPSRRSGQAALRQQLAETLQNVHAEVLALVAYLRALTYELHPPGLDEVGLTLALESYANHLKGQDGQPTPLLELDLDKIGPADLSMPLATSLFRAAQEALRNALGHARAQHLTLSLCRSPDWVVLSVCDDGCGFRVPARLSELAGRGHFGLVGMAERVAWAGGELEIRSLPGSGTDVIVRLPLEAERPADGEKTTH